ncbi:MAG: GNAT family N-acetyltransferase [Armatimonadetes bacterium]|nr:GNAT family N-acetyltransferase [Armatimonadota bacterium]
MIRKIKPEDKSPVLEIASKIWEGDDYLPQVFDEWIKDPNGVFAGLWENEILIGFGHLKYLTPTDIWLEGLRKDPDLNVKGVGEKLSHYYLKILKKNPNISSVRFSTYFDNNASIRLNEKLGFKKILYLSHKELGLEKVEKSHVHSNLKIAKDFNRIQKYVENSSFLKLSKNFICKGWTVYPYSRELLKQFYNQEQIFSFQENNVIKGVAIYSKVKYKDIFWISFLEAENELVYAELLQYLINLAKNQKKKNIEINLPDFPKLKKICEKYKFKSWKQENDFLLYELPLEIIK